MAEPTPREVKLVRKGSLLVAVAPPGTELLAHAQVSQAIRELREDRDCRSTAFDPDTSAMLKPMGKTENVAATSVPLTNLEPGRYELERDIPVVLEPSDNGFTATFLDANIGSSGDSEEEAIDNLRTLIVDTYELLESTQPDKLGREPRRRLASLRSLIRKI
jgi:hypothetical protein